MNNKSLVALSATLLGVLVTFSYMTYGRKKKKDYVLGIDFGGSFMKLALLDSLTGELEQSKVVAIAPSKEPNEVIDQMIHAGESLFKELQLSWSHLFAIGVCCPGRVENGIVSTVANLSNWIDVPLAKLLQSRTGCEKVQISNDANAALFGEMWTGTGVGGAVALNGKVCTGETGMFGEIGHHIIEVNGRLSSATGVKGISEEYCSVRAFQKTWTELCENGPSPPTTQEILLQAQLETNQIAMKVANICFNYIGVLIVNVCRFYDPARIVLGGGLCSDDWFVEKCRKSALNHHWSISPPTYSLERAKHGNWAGTIGAAWYAAHAQI